MLKADDSLIQVVAPRRGEPFPVPTGWGSTVWRSVEGVFDAPWGDAPGVGGADERPSSQYLPGEPALVPGGTRAVDESFGLVKVKSGDGDAAAARHLAHGQLVRRGRGSGHGLDLN